MSVPFGLLKFRPYVRSMPWGGDALRRLFGKDVPTGGKTGETWEIADRPEGASIVAEGPFQGRTLTDLYREDPKGLTGLADPPPRFPLLVKFIDARDWLSLQIHPDAEMARRLGAEPKTECWVVVEARPEAFLYLGLGFGNGPERLREALAEGRPEAVMNRVRVKAGDFLFVPAGTVHAIGPGIVLAEVQQNSNTTYRLWDWNRLGPDGAPRALQVEPGLACVKNDARAGKMGLFAARAGAASTAQLVGCPAFSLTQTALAGAHVLPMREVAQCLGFVSGSGTVRAGGQDAAFLAGDWFLVPPGLSVEIAPGKDAVCLSARPG